MKRYIFDELLKWKRSPVKKPLILRGARQVGKSWLMKRLGETYDKSIYINFQTDNRFIKDKVVNVKNIVTTFEIAFDITLNDNVLIIFDEIQENPNVLSALKYFHEERPDLNIICAGSQLGIISHQGYSFPVGMVDFLDVRPLSFAEFLEATDNKRLAKTVKECDYDIINTFHSDLTDLLKRYYLVGGMPEVVVNFAMNNNVSEVRRLQKSLLDLYYADLSKHIPAVSLPKARLIWNSIPHHLSKENKKFVWGSVKNGARAASYEDALQWVADFGLITKVKHISKPHFPISTYADEGIFKVYLHDVGLLGALAELDPEIILAGDAIFTEFKGALTEQFVIQELLHLSHPYYWSNNESEVDCIMQWKNIIYAIEVKAAENLKSKSLRVFNQKYGCACADGSGSGGSGAVGSDAGGSFEDGSMSGGSGDNGSREERSYDGGAHEECDKCRTTILRTSLSKYREQDWMINVPLYAIRAYFGLS